MNYIFAHWLDITTTLLGLIYIFLEYRASILLWLVGIIMPALDIVLYYTHGLYGDAAMAVYYTLAAIYGWLVWKFGRKHQQKEGDEMPITHMPKRLYPATILFFVVAWGRRLHQCPELCRPVGAGPQIRRAMALLDPRRCRELLPLRHQRHPLQSLPLRPLCRHRRHGILQMEETNCPLRVIN